MIKSRRRDFAAVLLAALLTTVAPVLAREPKILGGDAHPKAELPPLCAVGRMATAYFNTPDRRAVAIDKTGPTVVG